MTSKSNSDAGWKEFKEYAGSIFDRECCIEQGLLLEYTTLKVNRINNKSSISLALSNRKDTVKRPWGTRRNIWAKKHLLKLPEREVWK